MLKVNTTEGTATPIGADDPTVDEEKLLALAHRKAAYARVFNMADQDVQLVIQDLMKFGRAAESTAAFDPSGRHDPLASARYDGRREMWLRINEHLNIPIEDLYRLFNPSMRIR